MNERMIQMALRLRQRADRCREMAGRAFSASIATELQTIAEDYEKDAVRLETGDLSVSQDYLAALA
jgi:hypothetical protein